MGCRHCPRRPGDNPQINAEICTACFKRKNSYGTCPVLDCGAIRRRNGFRHLAKKGYCALHRGPALWRQSTRTARVLMVDDETGMIRVAYRWLESNAETASWSGRFSHLAQDRTVVGLYEHDAFVSRETKWAIAFKGSRDPVGLLDHVPWWIFQVHDAMNPTVASARDRMATCLRAGSPCGKQAFSALYPDRPVKTRDRYWERFKDLLVRWGVEHEKIKPEGHSDNRVLIGFNENHWRTFVSYVDQIELQKQEGSLWR